MWFSLQSIHGKANVCDQCYWRGGHLLLDSKQSTKLPSTMGIKEQCYIYSTHVMWLLCPLCLSEGCIKHFHVASVFSKVPPPPFSLSLECYWYKKFSFLPLFPSPANGIDRKSFHMYCCWRLLFFIFLLQQLMKACSLLMLIRCTKLEILSRH